MINYPYIYVTRLKNKKTGERYYCYYDFSDNSYFGISNEILTGQSSDNTSELKKDNTFFQSFVVSISIRLCITSACSMLTLLFPYETQKTILVLEIVLIPLIYLMQQKKTYEIFSRYKTTSLTLNNDVENIRNHYKNSRKERLKGLCIPALLSAAVIEYMYQFFYQQSVFVMIIILPCIYIINMWMIDSSPINKLRLFKLFKKNTNQSASQLVKENDGVEDDKN